MSDTPTPDQVQAALYHAVYIEHGTAPPLTEDGTHLLRLAEALRDSERQREELAGELRFSEDRGNAWVAVYRSLATMPEYAEVDTDAPDTGLKRALRTISLMKTKLVATSEQNAELARKLEATAHDLAETKKDIAAAESELATEKERSTKLTQTYTAWAENQKQQLAAERARVVQLGLAALECANQLERVGDSRKDAHFIRAVHAALAANAAPASSEEPKTDKRPARRCPKCERYTVLVSGVCECCGFLPDAAMAGEKGES
jgi:DNA repair exonuclease SbcCD ATPase subunit